jgi:predicted glycoside hydrolase/deacetylase ChbG (UPF0249 family)
VAEAGVPAQQRPDVAPAPPNPAAGRSIWLCADDYGISAAVNAAIRDLVVRGRINATSVMVNAPSLHRSEAKALSILNSGARRVALGLHVTLTAPFRPLTRDYRPLAQDAFLPLSTTLAYGLLHRLNRDALAREVLSQLRLFVHTFGRAPDFIDGHQHVHLFPQVRDAVLKVVKENAPLAWVRQCGSMLPLRQRVSDRKGFLIDAFSRQFRKRADALGVRTNPGFAGTYDFGDKANFAVLFPGFLDGLPAGSVVMCHPGFVDAELRRLDPLTTLREREYAFFSDDSFPGVLASRGIALA